MTFNAAEAFEKFSFDYLKIREKEYNHEDQLGMLAKYLEPLADKAVLELGCGNGHPVLKYFYDRGARVSGIDISKNMIANAKQKLPHGEFLCEDMTTSQLPSASYDAILSFYAIFVLDLEQQILMFEKIMSALKPGGFTYFTLLSESYTNKKEMGEFRDFMGHKLYFAHTTPEVYRAKLEAIGFSNITMEELSIGEDSNERCLWVFARKD